MNNNTAATSSSVNATSFNKPTVSLFNNKNASSSTAFAPKFQAATNQTTTNATQIPKFGQ